MTIDDTQKKLNEYFSEKLQTFGATPKGVDYNGPEAQEIRFEQLVKVIDSSVPLSVIDYGCGYGAMFDFLLKKGWDFEYYGVDLIEKMVLSGREAHKEFPNAHFTPHEKELSKADYQTFLNSRPRAAENEAVELMIRLSREVGTRVHIVHLSSADAVPLLREAQVDGVAIAAETCPHYLHFAAEDIPWRGTEFKCCPPIRERGNRERLWDGLAEGTIAMIVSDHSPSTADRKALDTGDFGTAWGGISSLQLGLPLVWTEARRRGHHLGDVVRWMCAGPAALAGLLLACALLVRANALVVAVPAVLALLFLRAHWTRPAVLATALVVPVLAYAAWYESVNGYFSLNGYGGQFLYARVAQFADRDGLGPRDGDRIQAVLRGLADRLHDRPPLALAVHLVHCFVEVRRRITVGGRTLDALACPLDDLPEGFAVPGPAVLAGADATALVEPGWRGVVLASGALVLRREGA